MTKMLIDRAVVEEVIATIEDSGEIMFAALVERQDRAVDALRAALAEQQEQAEPVKHKHQWISTGGMEPGKMRCIHCGAWGQKAEPLQEPVQEPVQQALVEADRIMGHDDEATEWRERWGHLFERLPQRPSEPVQEPVAWMDVLENGYKCLAGRPIQGWTPIYTAPPQRKPLSGIEVERLLEQVIGSLHVARKLVRAVELAHGIGAKP